MEPSNFEPDIRHLRVLITRASSLLDTYESAGSSAEKMGALQALSRASRKLSFASTSPIDAFANFNFEPLANAVVRVALSMDLFAHLSASHAVSIEELATLTRAEVDFTARIVRALVGLDFLELTDDGSCLPTPLALMYQDETRKSYAIWMWDVMIRASGSVGSYFEAGAFEIPKDQTKTPFAWAYESTDEGLFETVQRIGKLPLMAKAMSGSSELCAKEAVATFDFSSISADSDQVVLVDVGGAKGQTLIEIRRANPSLRGRMVLQDLPKVLDSGLPEDLEAETQVYDFFQDIQPVKGAAVYLFQRIFHDWNDENSRLILRNLKPAMSSASKLLICDVVLTDVEPYRLKVLRDMNMLLVGGMERSEKQWRQLLESEGFAIQRFYGLQNQGNSIIEAKIS